MVGFFVMSVLWTSIALIGNSIHPTSVMEGKTFIDVLTNVFQTGPENYGKAILVNIFLRRLLRQSPDRHRDCRYADS
ncbi:hypothetical protein ACFTAO_14775 [Paenibacillus rhizoplanae]